MSNKSTYALIRVSTDKQNEARQIKRMLELNIPKKNIIIEKESGRSTERTKYHSLVKRLKAGDTLHIENTDRLSRYYDGIIEQWHLLTKNKGVIVKILDTPMLDTDQTEDDLMNRFMRDVMLLIQAYHSEYSWSQIKTRQAQGIAVAKASGKHLGRPKTVKTKKEIRIATQYLNREITLGTALSMLDIKKSAFYMLCQTVREE